MAQLQTATLDNNAETMTINVDGTERVMVVMDFTGTATVTWTVAALGGTKFSALRKADNTTAAAYTADDHFMAEGPCTLVATASGVSGGSCVIEARAAFTN